MRQLFTFSFVIALLMISTMSFAEPIRLMKQDIDITKHSYFDVAQNEAGSKMHELITSMVDRSWSQLSQVDEGFAYRSQPDQSIIYLTFQGMVKPGMILESLDNDKKDSQFLIYAYYCEYEYVKATIDRSLKNLQGNSDPKSVELREQLRALRPQITKFQGDLLSLVDAPSYSDSEIQQHFRLTAKQELPRIIEYTGGIDRYAIW